MRVYEATATDLQSKHQSENRRSRMAL